MGLAELLESSTSFGRNATPVNNIEGNTFLSFWNRSEEPVKLKNLGVVASGEIQAGGFLVDFLVHQGRIVPAEDTVA